MPTSERRASGFYWGRPARELGARLGVHQLLTHAPLSPKLDLDCGVDRTGPAMRDKNGPSRSVTCYSEARPLEGRGRTTMRRMAAGVFLLLGIGIGGAAQAEIMAAGAAYGSNAQVTGVCYLFNAGSTSVVVSSIRIYDEVGNAYIVISGNCGTLAPNRSCRTVARIFSDIAYSCKALVSSKANLRGELEFRDSAGTVLSNLELR
jgi:hypothetical protein